MPRRLTTNEFIERARKVHGDKYDYSKSIYRYSKENLIIICPEHGIFEQTPNNHMRGKGCANCSYEKMAKNRKKDIGAFIQKSKKTHSNKYDYSQVKYINNKTKVKIICPEHGIFEQTPLEHYRYGCSSCAKNKRLTDTEFIERARKVHGDKYNYSLVDYKNSKCEVIIICPIHGNFKQNAHSHIQGNGCSKCSSKYSCTTKEFIDKVKDIHGNKYDYSLTIYKNRKSKIKIKCPKHGIFTQIAGKHLDGSGCPKCNESKGERKIRLYLKKNKIPYDYQKSFDDCVHKYKLRYDFYLPSHNLLVEYNGRQHYQAVKIFGGKGGLKKTRKRDQIKEQYSKDNNINLLIISYNHYDDIDTILDNYIKSFDENKTNGKSDFQHFR